MAQLAAQIVSHDDEFRRRMGRLLRSGPIPVSVLEEAREGSPADLVIIDGNPLTDIYDVLKVVTTVKDGRVVWESSQAVAR